MTRGRDDVAQLILIWGSAPYPGIFRIDASFPEDGTRRGESNPPRRSSGNPAPGSALELLPSSALSSARVNHDATLTSQPQQALNR